jgi:hypothetical protein
MLVTELVRGAIGSTLSILGAASILVRSLRRKSVDRVTLFFGIWCCLYGIRVIGLQEFIRAALGGSTKGWNFLTAFLTHLINVPTGLFLESLIGPGWKDSIRRTWQVQGAYAIVAIGTDLVLRRPGAAMGPNDTIVLAGMIVWVGNLWRYRQRLAPILAARGVALAIVLASSSLTSPATGFPQRLWLRWSKSRFLRRPLMQAIPGRCWPV